MTNTNGAATGIYRNSNLIAVGFVSVNGHYQTTTVVGLERLDVNDIVRTVDCFQNPQQFLLFLFI
jgi:hypothetical protein